MNKLFSISSKTLSVAVLIFLCLILWGIRIKISGETTGIFLAWNLFLAILPLFFILLARKIYIVYGYQKRFQKLAVLGLMMLWLLFFPNSPYIITDLIHLNHLPVSLLWFDSLGIFLTAMTALMVGLYSVDIFRNLTREIAGNKISLLLTISSLILSAFGVYLGRYIRLNSWDLFTQPFDLLRVIFSQMTEPLAVKMTFVFGLVLVGMYFSFNQFLSNYANPKNDTKL